jgi:hypothetical protein
MDSGDRDYRCSDHRYYNEKNEEDEKCSKFLQVESQKYCAKKQKYHKTLSALLCQDSQRPVVAVGVN